MATAQMGTITVKKQRRGTDNTRKRRAAVKTVRRDHLEALVGELKQPYKTMVLAQWALGLRPGEACRLRYADVDTETGELITPIDGKTGERRLFFDTEGQFAESLREWIQQRPLGEFMFGGKKPVLRNTYYMQVTRHCDELGIPRFTPYALRHTYATDLIHERQAISDVSAALGHRSVLTTAQYYLHADPDMLRRLNKGR